MLDHLGIPCVDPEAAAAFYTPAFAPLGFREAMRYDTPAGPVIGLAGPDGFASGVIPPPAGTTT